MKHILKIALPLLLVGITYAHLKKQIKVACIGDSITFGARVEEREKNCYPVKLNEFLGQDYSVKNFGVSGSTALKKGNKPYFKTQKFKEALNFMPDKVIIKLGTNDSKPMNWDKYSKQFIADYTYIVHEFQKLESKPEIWICYPVKSYATGKPIRGEIISEQIIPKITEIAKNTGVKIIHLNHTLTNEKYYHEDKIHPNALGANIIAKSVYKAITE